MKKRIFIISLLVLCLVTLCACNDPSAFKERKVSATNLTASVQSREVEGKAVDAAFSLAYDDFAVKMLQNLYKGENACISPLSIYAAMSMLTNGAVGETKTELETLLGSNVDSLNAYFAKLMQKSDEKGKLLVANSVWSKQGAVNVEKNFLDIVRNYYLAEVYSAAFDEGTLTDINNWVYNNTRGGIDKILDRIEKDAVMYLINALDFEAEWENKFESDRILDRNFNGKTRTSTVSMMYDEVNEYFVLDNAKGFAKQYEGGEYKFAAFLPDEGVDIEDFVKSLTGEKLAAALSNMSYSSVDIGLPEFESESNFELVETFEKLGATKAFKYGDYSALGSSDNGELAVSKVIHKTHITVGAEKTKASAVTDTELECGAALPEFSRTVILDRPFVYMILDSNNLPIFIGLIANL